MVLGTPQKRQKKTVAPPFPKSARSFDRSLMTHKFGPGARRAVGLKVFLQKPPKHAKTPRRDGPLSYKCRKLMGGVINKDITTV